MMTPLQLEILIHYSYSAVDYRDGDFSAPAVREAIDAFRDQSALLTKSENFGQSYTLSERGRVYIHHLLNQPLPIRTWTVPRGVPEGPAK
jgi:hypothetical protein